MILNGFPSSQNGESKRTPQGHKTTANDVDSYPNKLALPETEGTIGERGIALTRDTTSRHPLTIIFIIPGAG